MKNLKLTIFAVCIISQSWAQAPDPYYQQSYKKALSLYNSGDYLPSLSEFSFLTSTSYNNDLVPYAHYYYSLSALKLKRAADGLQKLQQLRDRFPTWNKMDDVNYLSANLCFMQKQYGRAIGYLQAINSSAIRQDADQLEKFYINQILEVPTLKSLNQQFPNNKNISQALINVSVVQTSTKAKKQGINVAILFPFRLDDFAIDQRERSNQYAFDYFEGMKMAQSKLNQEGINVNFTTFDLGNDLKATNNVLNSISFQQNDLVFGPLYTESAKLVADYVDANKMYMVLPTTITSDVIENHNNTFLTHATLESQAVSIFDFMTKQTIVYPKKLAIYYNPTRRDSAIASAYKAKALAAGYQVIDYRKTREKIDSTSTINERNKPSYIFVSSSNDNDGSKVLAMLTKKHLNIPVAFTASSFDWNKTSLSSFANKNSFIIGNELVDQNKAQVKDFQKLYFSKRNTIPSIYVMQGYDMMLFYGRMLQKYKSNLRLGLDLRFYDDDYLLQGFDYQKNNDNRAINIFKIEDDRLVTIEK